MAGRFKCGEIIILFSTIVLFLQDACSYIYFRHFMSDNQKSKGGDSDAPGTGSKGPMGPVFSTFVYEEESANDL